MTSYDMICKKLDVLKQQKYDFLQKQFLYLKFASKLKLEFDIIPGLTDT